MNMLSNKKKPQDVVICDLHLPTGDSADPIRDGFSLMRRIERLRGYQRSIFLSFRVCERDRMEAQGFGAQIMKKQLQYSEFVKHVWGMYERSKETT